MSDRRVFIDTNILIHANAIQSPVHVQAKNHLALISGEFDELWISVQVVREYMATKSRLTFLANTYDANEILLDVKEFENIFIIASNDLITQNELLKLAVKYEVKGKQIHDCNLIATMLQYGIANILTQNVGDFNRYEPEGINIIPLII